MVTMRKDNVYRIVAHEDVRDLELRGFSIVCEDNGEGGQPLSPEPVRMEEPKIEPVEFFEKKDNPKMLGDRYWNQLNKPQLITLFNRENVKYSEYDTVPMLRDKYKKYLDEIKQK